MFHFQENGSSFIFQPNCTFHFLNTPESLRSNATLTRYQERRYPTGTSRTAGFPEQLRGKPGTVTEAATESLSNAFIICDGFALESTAFTFVYSLLERKQKSVTFSLMVSNLSVVWYLHWKPASMRNCCYQQARNLSPPSQKEAFLQNLPSSCNQILPSVPPANYLICACNAHFQRHAALCLQCDSGKEEKGIPRLIFSLEFPFYKRNFFQCLVKKK